MLRRGASPQVERGPDRLAEHGFLVGQEEAELAAERIDGNRDDVVATDDAVVVKPVGWTDWHLG